MSNFNPQKNGMKNVRYKKLSYVTAPSYGDVVGWNETK
jgi:hypothetical protein